MYSLALAVLLFTICAQGAPVYKGEIISESDSSTRCVSNCEGMPDGDYQSCKSCDVYVTCSNKIIHDDRPCPDGLVWDDNLKRCEWKSTTCGTDNCEGTSCTDDGCGNCLSSCKNMPDGDYQSCNGCNVYVTCSNEIIHDDRPCPDGLVWDDNLKRCEWKSTTCGTDNCDGTPGTDPTPNPCPCVSSCTGMPDGDYQSCNGCNVYVTCSNEIIHDDRPCPDGLVWDDNLKRCEWESTTCGTDSCGNSDGDSDGNSDGDSDGDSDGNSDGDSDGNSDGDSDGNSDGDSDGNSDGDSDGNSDGDSDGNSDGDEDPDPDDNCHCVSSCTGMPDGDYQSCFGCHVFATCSNGNLYDKRPCPEGLVWDDNLKRCEWESDTCDSDVKTGKCVDDCTGVPDGDYQSCQGCNMYATCSNEDLYDERPCPANLVWDDHKKRCEWESTTCHEIASRSAKR